MCQYGRKENDMKNFKYLYVILFVIAMLCGCSSANAEANGYSDGNVLAESAEGNAVHFIDVGQGDSILVASEGKYMLVDAGEEDKGDTVVDYLAGLGVSELEYVVATHPHSDHIGGMDDVINSFDVKNIILPDMASSTKCYENMLDAVESKNVNAVKGEAGYSFEFGDFECNIVAPVVIGDDANNNSVVMKLVYGNDSILLTGDCSDDEESDILESGADISVDLLKVGHHGSYSSSSEEFIQKVSPKAAIISCGKDNEYGHPHSQTLDTLNKYGVEIHRTDEEGTIIAYCSGNGISIGGVVVSTDESTEETSAAAAETTAVSQTNSDSNVYILNNNTKKFHRTDCKSAAEISESNREEYTGTAEELIDKGYSACGICKPQ